MTKKECLDFFETCCYDFWGEEKSPKAIMEAWEDILNSLREDGEQVPEYKLTKKEIDKLLRV